MRSFDAACAQKNYTLPQIISIISELKFTNTYLLACGLAVFKQLVLIIGEGIGSLVARLLI